ncbi:PIG-L deacetylase family protein [Propionibacteriaceae bacterium G57]|uniref:PIG-L deacetylase family protein n=1 Tax=Aestuariimicrobium sp. G57 TaxID=3418485 RepID=UPI003DA794C9
MNETLPILDLGDVKRVLVVVAHPDDPEYGTSAAVGAWVEAGIQVSYLLLTAGEAGMQIPPAEVAPLRAGEQRAACAVVGVDDLVILNHPDGMLNDSMALRTDIARRIRQLQPDVVMGSTWEIAASWGLNMADHRVAGLATLDAIRDADNTWVFPELARDENLPKWGATWFVVTGHSQPDHVIAVQQQHVDKAVASLECHREYLAAIPGHPAPAEFLPEVLRDGGRSGGVEYGLAVKAFKLRD